jgi:hypothetical protein
MTRIEIPKGATAQIVEADRAIRVAQQAFGLVLRAIAAALDVDMAEYELAPDGSAFVERKQEEHA